MLKAAQWSGAGGVALHPNKPNLAPFATCELRAGNQHLAKSVDGRSTTRGRERMLSIAFHRGSGEMERTNCERLQGKGCFTKKSQMTSVARTLFEGSPAIRLVKPPFPPGQ